MNSFGNFIRKHRQAQSGQMSRGVLVEAFKISQIASQCAARFCPIYFVTEKMRRIHVYFLEKEEQSFYALT